MSKVQVTTNDASKTTYLDANDNELPGPPAEPKTKKPEGGK
jgi:hypothetical protein